MPLSRRSSFKKLFKRSQSKELLEASKQEHSEADNDSNNNDQANSPELSPLEGPSAEEVFIGESKNTKSVSCSQEEISDCQQISNISTFMISDVTEELTSEGKILFVRRIFCKTVYEDIFCKKKLY